MSAPTVNPLRYQDSGVNIDAGNDLSRRIKDLARATQRAGVLGGIGGFGALFEVPLDRYKKPVLVSAADGVGTKLKLARDRDIGIDLVAMCVNDILACGGEPLYFLDYLACGALDPQRAARIIAGIARGCELANCALAGGETAEMPGMYARDEYDLAGFAVGIAEKDKLLSPQRVRAGDIVLGLASSGPHANGFSLVRKVLEQSGASLSAMMPQLSAVSPVKPPTVSSAVSPKEPPTVSPTKPPTVSSAESPAVSSAVSPTVSPMEPPTVSPTVSPTASPATRDETLADALLAPTRIYVKSVLQLLAAVEVSAIAHITGGGLIENPPRVLPPGIVAEIDSAAWTRPAVFDWLQQHGNIAEEEMLRVFNCGIGMLAVVPARESARAAEILEAAGETVFRIGKITAAPDATSPPRVVVA